MVKGWEGLWEVPGSSPNRDKNLPIKKNLPCKLLKKKMVSSMNYKCGTLVLLLPTRKSSNSRIPLSFVLNNILLKTSTAMVKRDGARGKPLVTLNHPSTLPFNKTTKFVEDMHLLIQVLHLVLNPFLSKKKPKST